MGFQTLFFSVHYPFKERDCYTRACACVGRSLYRVILALVRILIFLFSRDTIPLIIEGYCYIGVCACIGRVLGFSYIFNISLFSWYTIPLKRGIVILEFVLVLGGL